MYFYYHDYPNFYALDEQFVKTGRYEINEVGLSLGIAYGPYREALAKTASAETQLSESDEIEDSPPAKRAKADDDSKPHVYALLISTGQTSLEDTSIIGLYKTWADAIKKAKHVLAWGESGKGHEFWNPVAHGGYIPEDPDDEYGDNLEYYGDHTDKYATEPKKKYDWESSSVEVAHAKHGEGGYGNMSMCIQKVALP